MITVAYKNFIRNLAQALNNDTSINDNDVNAIFEFEQNIAKVNFLYSTKNILFYTFFFSKYHWTPSDQNARRAETIYTTLGNLTTVMNTNVSNVRMSHHFSFHD